MTQITITLIIPCLTDEIQYAVFSCQVSSLVSWWGYCVSVIDREQSFPVPVPLEEANVHVMGPQTLLKLTQKNRTILGSDQIRGKGFPLL